MEAVARALRPHQLDGVKLYREAPPLVAEAHQHMWIIAIASFLAIMALAAMALLLGRRALRPAASARALAWLENGAIMSLVGGLVVGLGFPYLSLAGGIFSIFEDKGFLLTSIGIAGAVGSFILSGIAVRRSTARPEPVATHRRAGVCLVVASLIILAGFFLLTQGAQFIIGFTLHFVGF
ncbi:MAG: hypothetical protein ACXVDA_22010 [Ktedonobacterales bacterium]